MRTRGKFIFKESWWSYCSAHQTYDENCEICQSGNWHNNIMVAFSGFVHDHWYGLWYWWVNNL